MKLKEIDMTLENPLFEIEAGAKHIDSLQTCNADNNNTLTNRKFSASVHNNSTNHTLVKMCQIPNKTAKNRQSTYMKLIEVRLKVIYKCEYFTIKTFPVAGEPLLTIDRSDWSSCIKVLLNNCLKTYWKIVWYFNKKKERKQSTYV